jgi:hypothetical protein
LVQYVSPTLQPQARVEAHHRKCHLTSLHGVLSTNTHDTVIPGNHFLSHISARSQSCKSLQTFLGALFHQQSTTGTTITTMDTTEANNPDLLVCVACGTEFDQPADKPLESCVICDVWSSPFHLAHGQSTSLIARHAKYSHKQHECISPTN